jgi:MFS family permease
MVVSFLPWGIFMDRYSAPLTMICSWALQVAGFVLMYFVAGYGQFLALRIACGVAMGGNVIAFYPFVMHFTRGRETSDGMNLHATLWGVRWLLMPMLVAAVVDMDLFPMRAMFIVGALMGVAGLAVMAGVWRGERRAPAPCGD